MAVQAIRQEVCSRFNNQMYRLGPDVSTGFAVYITLDVLTTMSGIIEATLPSPKNNARNREALEHHSDADLVACASAQPDTSKGYVANQLLAERRAAREEQAANLAEERHEALIREIKKPHWSTTPTFIASVIAAVSGVVAVWPEKPPTQTPASPAAGFSASAPAAPSPSEPSSMPPISSSASQPQGIRK